MKSSIPTIYLLLCGDIPGLAQGHLTDWLKQLPELSIIANTVPVTLFQQPSADLVPDDWIAIAKKIKLLATKADGFVILHDTEHLLFTGAALSFMLQGLHRPVVLTNSHTFDLNTSSDAKANLINAVQVASYRLNEVGLMYRSRLLRINRLNESQAEHGVFLTPDQALLGKIDFSVRLSEAPAKPRVADETIQLDQNVTVIELTPALQAKQFNRCAENSSAIIINAGAHAAIPHHLLNLVEEMKKKIPVILWAPHVTPSRLAIGHLLLVTTMTWPTTVAKSMWALSQTKNLKEFKDLLYRGLAHELLDR